MALESIEKWLREHGFKVIREGKTLIAKIYNDTICIEYHTPITNKKFFTVTINGNGYEKFYNVNALKTYIAERYRALFVDNFRGAIPRRRLQVVTVHIPGEILVRIDSLVEMGFFPTRSEAIRYFLLRSLEDFIKTVVLGIRNSEPRSGN